MSQSELVGTWTHTIYSQWEEPYYNAMYQLNSDGTGIMTFSAETEEDRTYPTDISDIFWEEESTDGGIYRAIITSKKYLDKSEVSFGDVNNPDNVWKKTDKTIEQIMQENPSMTIWE